MSSLPLSNKKGTDSSSSDSPKLEHKFRVSAIPSSKKQSWEETYLNLVEYQQEHGDCNVPYRYAANKRLGPWVAKQKRTREKLTAEQIQKLDDLGFNWKKQKERQDENWMRFFNKLKERKAKHGHCDVIALDEGDPALGAWVSTQRMFNKKGQLPAHRFELLSKLGMIWFKKDPGIRHYKHHDLAFHDMYERLSEFKKANGHCLVPTNTSSRDTFADKRLSSWVSNVRTDYRNGDLKLKRIQMLEEIGFVWKVDHYDPESSLHQKHWEDMFVELQRFAKEFDHTQVPASGQTEGYHAKLGMWVAMQRTFYRNGDKFLTDARKQKLNSIGMWWGSGGKNHYMEPILEKQWEEQFQALKEFKRKNKHLLVPTNGNDKVLGSWVTSQRRLNNKNELRPDRKQRLEDLGLPWDGTSKRIAYKWTAMYDRLHDFHKETGHTCVPSTHTDSKLAGWVGKQRMKRADEIYMTEERRNLLDELDFTWSIGKGQFDKTLAKSKKHRKRKRDTPDIGNTLAERS